jgi:acetoin utilization deacetylase AcuC-like enzyme
MADPLPTGFLLHPAAPLHDPGWGHPEHQGRLRALSSHVGRDMIALHQKVVQLEPRSATEKELLRVHTREHLDRVQAASDQAMEEQRSVPLESDTLVSGASWDAAVGSSGAVLAALEGMAQGFVKNAFVATRPPGHHATSDTPMGFCLFNHAAVAARFIQDQGLAKRVLIVDWDVHHGNGTQDIFYEDPEVFYFSLHQFPFYPGTGQADETGSGPGERTTLNVPLPMNTPRGDYEARFLEGIREVWDRFAPEFVLISSGFDVLSGDPLGGMNVEPEDLHRFTREIIELAQETAEGRVVALLEGGYAPERVGEGTVAVLRALAGLEPKE